MSKTGTITNLVLGLGLLILGLTGSTVLIAQDNEVIEENDNVLEEIIVVAQKREQALMDVGIAITALTADAMVEMGMTNTQDIMQQVPGLMMQQTRGAWIIRGAGSQAQTGLESATSVYIDDVYFPFAEASALQLYDMKQVEVLKGPQGTLFGRNATAGLVHFRTVDPTDEAGGFVDLTVGEFGFLRAEAALGGAIGERSAFRIAALVSERDGFITSHNPDIPDQSESSAKSVRGKLQFDPTDELSILVSGFYSDQDTDENYARLHRVSEFGPDGLGHLVGPPQTDIYGWRNPEGYDAWNTWADEDSWETKKFWGGSVKLVWANDSITINSVTSYIKGESTFWLDADGGGFPMVSAGSAAPALYEPDYPLRPAKNSALTQEIRVDGGSDSLHWTVGMYYIDIEGSGTVGLCFRPGAIDPSFGACINSLNDQSAESLSGFAQVEYDINDRFRLIAGLRYTSEELRSQDESWLTFDDGFVLNDPEENRKRDMDSPWSGRLALQFMATDSILTYISYNKGIKSGGFNGLVAPPEIQEYEDEQLNAYEIGAKFGISDSTELTAAAFYYDYDGFHIRDFDQDADAVFTRNAPVKITGGEIEIRTVISENFQLSAGLSLLDTEVRDISREVDGQVFFWATRKMQQAPPYTFNLSGTYRVPVGSGSLELHSNLNFVGEQEFTSFNDPSMHEDSYVYGFGSIKYVPGSGRWELSAWLKNMFNEVYKRGGDEVSSEGFIQIPLNPPRMAGVSLRVHFGH